MALNFGSPSLWFGYDVTALESKAVVSICYDTNGNVITDGNAIQWAVYLNFADLQAGTVIASGTDIISAGRLTIESEWLPTVGTNVLIAALDNTGVYCLDDSESVVDLLAL